MIGFSKMLRAPVGLAFVAGGLLVTSTAWAFPTDLQMRASSVPNSCDYGVFQPELKITNTLSSELNMASVFVEFAFNSAQPIEAVHSEITVATFHPNGAFNNWHTARVFGPELVGDTVALSPDRRFNQIWRVVFDPPNPQRPTAHAIPANGGFVLATVTLRREGGAFPFDPECDDFTKVDRGTSQVAFVDNKFMHLRFTSTQQLICEEKLAGGFDPLSGIEFASVEQDACP